MYIDSRSGATPLCQQSHWNVSLNPGGIFIFALSLSVINDNLNTQSMIIAIGASQFIAITIIIITITRLEHHRTLNRFEGHHRWCYDDKSIANSHIDWEIVRITVRLVNVSSKCYMLLVLRMAHKCLFVKLFQGNKISIGKTSAQTIICNIMPTMYRSNPHKT